MPAGYLGLVLHAHLPYVRHPEQAVSLEENWLFEALSETYLPLLQVFERLRAEGVPFRVNLSLSPTLVAMLEDDLLRARYLAHLEQSIRLAEREVRRTRGDPHFHPLAEMYQRWFCDTRALFGEHYGGQLLPAFRRLQESGCVELMTTAATHGYLPLLRTQPAAVRAQLQVAAAQHRRAFGVPAQGVWLPECGYYPGLEKLVRDAGFTYFILDTHGVLHADPRPLAGIYAPLDCGNGVAAFGREPESSRQVWSAETGYPGDFAYRDFYRDIGFDLPAADLGDLACSYTGFKYYRVTGKSAHKAPYDPPVAARRAAEHAAHFVAERQRQAARALPHLARPPLLVCPYDAELFGHWWFEGPQWLEHVLRAVGRDGEVLQGVTLGEYLRRYPDMQVATPSLSSWGEHGYHAFWLNPRTDWVYPYLHEAARAMQDLVRAHAPAPPGGLADRALRLAARTLLLAQASDWTFILKNGTLVDYAERRIREHLARFHYLEQALRSGRLDARRLAGLETLEPLFPGLDYRVFAD